MKALYLAEYTAAETYYKIRIGFWQDKLLKCDMLSADWYLCIENINRLSAESANVFVTIYRKYFFEFIFHYCLPNTHS